MSFAATSGSPVDRRKNLPKTQKKNKKIQQEFSFLSFAATMRLTKMSEHYTKPSKHYTKPPSARQKRRRRGFSKEERGKVAYGVQLGQSATLIAKNLG
jgi:hypothetical protein